MSAYAATTSRVRLGQMCTCMSYRNPAYLAKVAATVDVISGGRVEMGIGGGWYEQEWRAYGYGFPPVAERLARLREGVEIMHQAWTTGTATLDGEHYQVDGAIVQPQPLQEGGIPIWIAGGGEKVTLRIAAKYAQYTNFTGSLEEFAHKSDMLRAALRGGRHRLRRDHALVELQHHHRHGCRGRRPSARRDRGARRAVPRAREDRAATSPTSTARTPRWGRRSRSSRSSPSGASSASTTSSRTSPRRRTTARGSSCGRRRSFPRCGSGRARQCARAHRARACAVPEGAASRARGLRRDGLVELVGELRVGRLGEVGAVGEDDDRDLGAAADRLGALGAVEDDLEVDVVVVDAAAVEERLRTAAVAAPSAPYIVIRAGFRSEIAGEVTPEPYAARLSGIPSFGFPPAPVADSGACGSRRRCSCRATTPASRCRPT